MIEMTDENYESFYGFEQDREDFIKEREIAKYKHMEKDELAELLYDTAIQLKRINKEIAKMGIVIDTETRMTGYRWDNETGKYIRVV